MLQGICRERPGLVVERVDVVLRPGEALRAGVRMIPCLVREDGARLSGILPGRAEIEEFLRDEAGDPAGTA